MFKTKYFYFVFLSVTFGMTSSTQYYYSNIMKRLFIGDTTVETVDDFWEVSGQENTFFDIYLFFGNEQINLNWG